MNRLFLGGIALFTTVSFASVVCAFEIVTHVKISESATDSSVLANKQKMLRLGMSSGEIRGANADAFPSSLSKLLAISELVAFGANWEDGRDEVLQSKRHFYNPLNGLGIYTGDDYYYLPPLFNKTFVPPVEIGISSARWAVEAGADRFGSETPPQQFSYRLGRRYFLDALTKSAKADRDKSWGLTFQIVGHVIHHIQDMAQPQHTRNDFHCDKLFCEVTGFLGGVKPSYEKWNARNAAISDKFAGYDPVYDAIQGGPFKRPEDFWSSGQGTSGIGLAQYTNRGFFTAGKNVGALNFPLPQIEEKNYTTETISTLCREQQEQGREKCPLGLNGSIRFFKTTVTDSLRPEATGVNSRAISRSIFDEDLKKRFLPIEAYSVNRFTYEATNGFVLKRAVAYSAGMINYFFRGNVDMVEDVSQPGTYAIKNLGNELMTGTFGLYYDDASDVRTLHKTWTLTIPAGGQVNVGAITAPTMPAPEKADEYMLVFNGDMGEETRATYGVGAVTGAVVTLGGGNALYLTGYNTASQLVHMKVDSTGTRVLGATEFHPLREMFAQPFREYGYVAGKKYLNRQVEFSANGESYRTRALTVGSLNPRDYTITYSFHGSAGSVRSGADYTKVINGFSWQADVAPISGTRARLYFTMGVPTYLSPLNLGFTRYVQIGGKWERMGFGEVALPALPYEIRNFAYSARGLENLLASPDGLTIYGFKTYVPGLGGPGASVQYNLALVINGDSTVTATWVLQRRDADIFTTVPRIVTAAGTYTARPPVCNPADYSQETVDLNLARHQAIGEAVYAQREATNYDYQNGKLLGLVQSFEIKGVSDIDYVKFDDGWGTDGCNQQWWTYGKFSGRYIEYGENRRSSVIESNGSTVSQVGTFSRDIPKPIIDPLNKFPGTVIDGGFTVDWEYEGFLSGAFVPFVRAGPENVAINGQVIVRALTADAADAIVSEYSGTPFPTTKFGSTQIPSYMEFIADASPLGEIFFALSDLSLVVHKPRAGGIKQWRPPAGVVRLIGAIWL